MYSLVDISTVHPLDTVKCWFNKLDNNWYIKDDSGSVSLNSSDIVNHVNPWLREFAIYQYCNSSTSKSAYPYDVDFKTNLWITLHKVTYPLAKGEPTHCIYYEDHTKTKPVCRIDFEFIRFHKDNAGEEGLHGMIKQKKSLLKWYKNDGSLSDESKDLGRTYTFPEDIQLMINEGVQKRGLIYESLKANVLQMLQVTMIPQGLTADEAKALGVNFIAEHKTAFDNYVDAYNTTIIDEVTAGTDSWLDNIIDANNTTIRQFILNELDLD